MGENCENGDNQICFEEQPDNIKSDTAQYVHWAVRRIVIRISKRGVEPKDDEGEIWKPPKLAGILCELEL